MKLPRLPRYVAPGMPLHVIQRGNNRSAHFAADDDYRMFREWVREAFKRHGCAVHAYVFMTNHMHFLTTESRPGGLAKAMQSVGRRYVQYFNTRYRRTGTLWEGRYRATLVDKQSYLFACYRYIELNPVRAGLVSDPAHYPWSSHRANALAESDPLVTPDVQYLGLDADPRERAAAYRGLFGIELDQETVQAIRDATNRGWALGSKRFRDEIAALLKRRTQALTGGRRLRWNDEL